VIFLLSPILLTTALMVLIKDGLPVLFRWQVMGYNRKPIRSWKFRTMVNNADELKKKLLQKK
jgi:lipopolysaccharide/colanic/teichoic acid biosynthesis glycosyltransferase